jgi:Matrixin
MKYQPLSLSMLTIAACASITIGSPISETDEYPIAIAHPDEILVEQLASQMFKLMPFEEKVKIARAGGIGSQEFDLSRFDTFRAGSSKIPTDLTAGEYARMIISDELDARMTQEQHNIVNAIIETIDSGKAVPMLCFSPDTDREYAYAINQLLELPLQTRYQQTSRWSSTATNGGGLTQGTPTTLTYSFVPDGTLVSNLGIGLGSGPSQLFAWMNSIYANQSTWQGLFAQVFDRWAELAGTSYIFEPNDDGVNTNTLGGQIGVRGDVRIAAFDFQNDGNGGVLAYNNFPQDGDMVFDAFDTFYNSTTNNSLRFRNVAAHEHGHGLGMLHVCPANQTKLMEPFVSTAYDGPQLDDTLNGIRHYGDFIEPNDSIAQATDLGTLAIGGTVALENVGVDDNTDDDYFKITLSETSRVTFNATPDADEYEDGNQTQSCSTAPTTNYNIIQDLRIKILNSSGSTVVIANTSGFGSTETAFYDALIPGDYFFIVDGATNVNNVQRYKIDAAVTEVPFLEPTIILSPPPTINPGVTTPLALTINPGSDILLPGSERLFYSINNGAFTSTALTSNGDDEYTATLPAVLCADLFAYYISIEGQDFGVVTFPSKGAGEPLTPVVGQIVDTFSDDFEADQGWTVSGSVVGTFSGQWERGVPLGFGDRGDPLTDADGSGSAFLTGNAPGNTDVDGGQTILTSPSFQMADNPEARISYYRWYDNTGAGNGSAPGEDIFTVEISNNNGDSWTTLEVVGPNTAESVGGWFNPVFRVASFVAPTDQVMLRFTAEDIGDGSVVEAAIDGILITGQLCEDPKNVCQADLTGDGTLNFFDVSAFIVAFSNQDAEGDFNNDGSYNFFDVSAFIVAFSAGCP